MLREARASRGGFQDGAGGAVSCAFGGVHGAVVGAVTPATGGQRRVIRLEREQERSRREDEDQEDGKGAPHPWTMLQELWCSLEFGISNAVRVSSMHLEFPYTFEGFDAVTSENHCFGRNIGCG